VIIMSSTTTRIGRGALMVLCVLVLNGCASMNVSSYVETGANIRQYHTYNWGPADTGATGDPRLDSNPFFDERVRAQVEKQLTSRGFEKRTSGVPDLLVHYHASVTQKIDVRTLDHDANYCQHADCKPFIYDMGTLFVDLVDPRDHKLVWRGWAEGSVDGVIDSQDWMNTRIDEAVRRIMKRLPL
jgi:Domain of unknown function (DUF4136)